ncbi:MAG: TauD/TfdA family dioxygenase [Pseudomonadota bacterium]
MAGRAELWRQTLGVGDTAELEAAAAHFLSLGRDIGQITKEDFPLDAFASSLAGLQEDLRSGAGVRVISGLPVHGYDRATAAAIFCGIGAHLGSARSQNAAGHILGHVRDTGANAADPNTRIYQTAERQSFHTDSADVVGLLCLQAAKEGGRSLLVSAEAIWNRMLNEAPELAALLFEPIATDRRGEVPEGENPWFDIPVLNWHDNHLTVCYQRQYIESAQRFDGVPALSPDKQAALDLFDRLANDPEMHFSMDLAPGDMQFVYNHNQLHDRTGFTDWPEPDKRRHLLRLWLSLPGDRALPPVFRQRYGSITPGDRGGIVVPGMTLNAPLD